VNTEQGRVHLDVQGPRAVLTFDRASARNALTWEMYQQLDSHLDRLKTDGTIRVAVLRGRNGTFVAGTDIAQFTTFATEADGLAYERRLEEIVERLETLNIPTLAVVEGAAVGAGLILAAVCDMRICTPEARFGMPIARTVGNCLSIANTARLIAGLGSTRTKAMIFTAEMIPAELAVDCGFVGEIVQPEALDTRVTALCNAITANAPITLAVTKEAVRRITQSHLPDGEDLIRQAYGSHDFREGVAAFLAKRPPEWRGE
jgi:enoyl-CoA hydratase/carnithine racemase